MYLDDFDYDSMDPDELSKFFPSRWEVWCVCVGGVVCGGGGVCVGGVVCGGGGVWEVWCVCV